MAIKVMAKIPIPVSECGHSLAVLVLKVNALIKIQAITVSIPIEAFMCPYLEGCISW